MRASRLIAFVFMTVLALSTLPAEAATTVNIVNGGSPSSFTGSIASPGSVINWHNSSSQTHTSTRTGAFGWATSNIAPGATSSGVLRKFPGRFPYVCGIHSGMVGTISIRPTASPASGTTSTTFTLAVVSINAPSGYVYDIQTKDAGGNWANWVTQTGMTKMVHPGATGTYYYRARIRKTSNNLTVSYSPARTIHI